MKCWLTSQECISCDEHHVVPRCNGGINGPTVMLRPDVHTALHRAHKNPELRDMFISALHPDNRHKALQLLQGLDRSMSGVKTHVVSVTVDDNVYKRITVIAESRGQSVTALLKSIVEGL